MEEDTINKIFYKFKYDPLSGLLSRQNSSAKMNGRLVGSKNKGGYLQFTFKGKNYLVHRVAYLLMTGAYGPNSL